MERFMDAQARAPDILDQARTRFRPGEEIVAAFIDIGGRLVLLSNRFLRVMLFRKHGIYSESAMELAQIQSRYTDWQLGWSVVVEAPPNLRIPVHLRKREVKPFRELLDRAIAASQSVEGGLGDQLAQLRELVREGALTQTEWERAKALYLGQKPDHQADAVRLVRSLYELHRVGALSEGEFNMKKWDILSRP